MAHDQGPIRPTNHPSESKSPGWKGTGGRESEEAAARKWNRAANEHSKGLAEEAKKQRIAERAEQIKEQFSQAKDLTRQPER